MKQVVFDINDYIKQNNINFSADYNIAIKELQKLSLFFYKNSINDFSVIFELINKNTIVANLLKVVVDKKLDVIKNNDCVELFDNDMLNLWVETYCIINNIDVYNEKKTESSAKSIRPNVEYTDNLEKYYMREINMPILTKDEERMLAYEVKKGNKKAKDEFVERNLKLVVAIANKKLNKGMDFLDLVQEGNLGLLKAVEKFDPNRGYKFSTYASCWIRSYIIIALAKQSKIYYIPRNKYEEINSYTAAEDELMRILGRTPTLYEIADRLGISEDQAKVLYNLKREPVRIDAKIKEDSEAEYGDYIPSNTSTPEDIVLNESMSDILKKVINSANLTKNEMKVITYRYYKGYKYKQIATIIGVETERARQIEAQAVKKLRRTKYTKSCAAYLPDENLAIKKLAYQNTQAVLNPNSTKMTF